MIAFPEMLLAPAEKAGIKIPKSWKDDLSDIDKNIYPYFCIFCFMQLGRRMPFPTSHWNNARIIAKIPKKKIKTITANEILGMGFE